MNRFTYEVKKLLDRVSGIPIQHSWGILSDEDTSLFRYSLASRIFLECDLLDVEVSTSRFRRLLFQQTEIEVVGYFQRLKGLKLALISSFNADEYEPTEEHWRRFKHDVGTDWLTNSLRPFYLGGFSKALEWLSYDERLNFRSLDYKSQILEAYIAQETEIKSYSYPEELVNSVNEILKDNLRDFNLWNHFPMPRNGPGAVAGREGRPTSFWKFRHCTVSRQYLSDVADAFGVPYGELLFSTNVEVAEDDDWKTCDLVVVPKNALTGRTISKEPIGLQWIQQAIREVLYFYISHCPRISSVLEDQERTRALCIAASTRGEWSTIDFSSASDYVTTTLVDLLFRGTSLHDILLSARSTRCRLSEDLTIPLEKYAPMGSSLCFPVMTLILDAVCRHAVGSLPCKYSPGPNWIVYGDDVIIRTEYADAFMQYATQLGFRVNMGKSYYQSSDRGQYREACGVEAISGYDITPLRIGRRFLSPSATSSYYGTQPGGSTYPRAEAWMAFADMSNQLYRYGFRKTRRFLGYYLGTLGRREYYRIARIDCDSAVDNVPTPYFITDLLTDTNYRAKVHYDASLQRSYIWVLASAAKVKPSRNEDMVEFWCYAADHLDDVSRLHTDSEARRDQDFFSGLVSKGKIALVWTRYYLV